MNNSSSQMPRIFYFHPSIIWTLFFYYFASILANDLVLIRLFVSLDGSCRISSGQSLSVAHVKGKFTLWSGSGASLRIGPYFAEGRGFFYAG